MAGSECDSSTAAGWWKANTKALEAKIAREASRVGELEDTLQKQASGLSIHPVSLSATDPATPRPGPAVRDECRSVPARRAKQLASFAGPSAGC